jgi:hypothetical protein
MTNCELCDGRIATARVGIAFAERAFSVLGPESQAPAVVALETSTVSAPAGSAPSDMQTILRVRGEL